VEKNAMEIAAVYLQPTKMEPMLPGMEQDKGIHLDGRHSRPEGEQQRIRRG
jgi:uncharacterized protein involved in high-affinity Fe2+ transport